ncbi:nacht nucleoside triphosphatase [Apiospora arundinis]|uniref:Nacht nucleoside triphosphatase n=1 Tax=Apiospora arundinis TaxID=335852 RepID=A0ABR2HYY9_9PEZI
MEALAAIGLASNILQFIEFGVTLVSESYEIHQSISGTTKEFDDLEHMCEYVGRLGADLEKAPPLRDNSVRSSIRAEDDLLQLARKCQKTTEALHSDLKTLHLDGHHRGKGASFRRALKVSLGRSRIKTLEKDVEKCRIDLMQCLMVISSHKQSTIVCQLEELRTANLNLVQDHSTSLHDITALVQNINQQAAVIQGTQEDNEILLESLRQQLAALNAKFDRRWMLEHSIVESLHYDTLHVRHDSIPEAHIKTFHWILERRARNKRGVVYPRSTFLTWLTKGDGLYWISGKPGSGKSTLMKFIAGHAKTQDTLGKWAGSAECTIAAYYFWSAGTSLQKTIEGLLRSLLFDIFTQKPQLMQIAVPDLWYAHSGSISTRQHDPQTVQPQRHWSVSNMTAALQRLASDTSVDQRFCIFIDGLDEYHGDHLDVIKVVKSLAEGRNFKLCVSSRPWNVFEDSLGGELVKKLYVHDLTAHDIQEYTSSTLGEDSNWKAGSLSDPRYQSLIDTITSRAQGVFLWVLLVVRSILEGVSDGDSIYLLEQRLERIPRDLEPFFRQILSSVSSLYYRQMALYFRVALEAMQPLTLMHYYYLDQCFESHQSVFDALIKPMDNYDIFTRHSTMRRRINARCKGLLEIHLVPSETRPYLSHQVTFLHRTVRDYLRTDEMTKYLENILDDYPANTTMLTAYIGLLKALPTSGKVGTLFQEALVYAHRAEKEAPEKAIICVEELYDIIPEREFLPSDSVQMARDVVGNGLCEFVAECIKARLSGFQDVKELIRYALESSRSMNLGQADMTDMIRLLLSKATQFPCIDTQTWVDHVYHLSRILDWTKSNLDFVKRQKQILDLVLPWVQSVNEGEYCGNVAWGYLLVSVGAYDWLTTPKALIDAHVELSLAVFAHGADPNAYYHSRTASYHIRTHNSTVFGAVYGIVQDQSPALEADKSLVSPRKAVRWRVSSEILAKLIEAMVKAGADLGGEVALDEKKLQKIFPRLTASHLIATIRHQKQLQAQRNTFAIGQPMEWVKWAASWVWRR